MKLFRTNRSLTKFFFLSLITLGIYGLVVISHISEEINWVARKDGKRTMHYCLVVFIFSWLTLGILPLIWWHKLCRRMNDELYTRFIDYSFGPVDFWCWNILGSLILVGPFIFIHKLMKAMNYLNEDFNLKGF